MRISDWSSDVGSSDLLPVIVHARRAVDAVVASIRSVGKLRGVVHSWSGSRQQAEQLWDLGFLLGIGGPVTYERARRLRELVAGRSEEHTSELQSLMRISYAVFCLKKTNNNTRDITY